MDDALTSLIDDAVHSHPEPGDTAPAVRAELKDLTPPEEIPLDGGSPPLDRTGAPYDSAIHLDPPQLTVRGTWRKRPGAQPASAPQRTPESAARELCDLAFGTGALALNALLPTPAGWMPSADERGNIERELARFFQAHPEWMMDLPPGLALALAVTQYLIPRVWLLPAVQQRMQRRTARAAATERSAPFAEAA